MSQSRIQERNFCKDLGSFNWKLNVYLIHTAQNAKNIEQPDHHNNDNDRVQNAFNGTLHRDERVDEPKNDSNSNKDKDDS